MQWLLYVAGVSHVVPTASAGSRKSDVCPVTCHPVSNPVALVTVTGLKAPQAVCSWPFNVMPRDRRGLQGTDRTAKLVDREAAVLCQLDIPRFNR